MAHDLNPGEQLQLLGAEGVLAAECAINRGGFREQAEAALAQMISEGCTFTADRLRDHISSDVEPHHPNVLPAVIRSAARRGLIEPVGWEPSTRPTRHASVNRVWRAR